VVGVYKSGWGLRVSQLADLRIQYPNLTTQSNKNNLTTQSKHNNLNNTTNSRGEGSGGRLQEPPLPHLLRRGAPLLCAGASAACPRLPCRAVWAAVVTSRLRLSCARAVVRCGQLSAPLGSGSGAVGSGNAGGVWASAGLLIRQRRGQQGWALTFVGSGCGGSSSDEKL